MKTTSPSRAVDYSAPLAVQRKYFLPAGSSRPAVVNESYFAGPKRLALVMYSLIAARAIEPDGAKDAYFAAPAEVSQAALAEHCGVARTTWTEWGTRFSNAAHFSSYDRGSRRVKAIETPANRQYLQRRRLGANRPNQWRRNGLEIEAQPEPGSRAAEGRIVEVPAGFGEVPKWIRHLGLEPDHLTVLIFYFIRGLGRGHVDVTQKTVAERCHVSVRTVYAANCAIERVGADDCSACNGTGQAAELCSRCTGTGKSGQLDRRGREVRCHSSHCRRGHVACDTCAGRGFIPAVFRVVNEKPQRCADGALRRGAQRVLFTRTGQFTQTAASRLRATFVRSIEQLGESGAQTFGRPALRLLDDVVAGAVDAPMTDVQVLRVVRHQLEEARFPAWVIRTLFPSSPAPADSPPLRR